ncbi:hypothetical protein ACTQ49_05445 [Luteococcus sp. Sow4_B9]|uniref:hypothetical protein n=1 Tax=Luteococcus sp. Sow4_B9 TaxID=3438792 RepID=UPI003F9C1452
MSACSSTETGFTRVAGNSGARVTATRTTTRRVARPAARPATRSGGSHANRTYLGPTSLRSGGQPAVRHSSGGPGLPAVPPPSARNGNRHYVDTTCIASVGTPCAFEDYVVTAPPAQPAPPAADPAVPAQPGQPAAAAPPPAPVIDVISVATTAASQINLPLPAPHLGPEPSVNEWNMLAVGLPVWIWTDDTDTINASVTEQGIPVTLVAHRVRTTVDTGDGTTLTCTSASPRPTDADPMAESPDCGHTWRSPGNPTITATSVWAVEWSALGQAGLITMQRSADRTVEVGELVSVVTR